MSTGLGCLPGGIVVSFRLPTQKVGGSIPVSASPREVRLVMSVMIMSDNVSNTYFISVLPPGGGGGGGTLLNGNL